MAKTTGTPQEEKKALKNPIQPESGAAHPARFCSRHVVVKETEKRVTLLLSAVFVFTKLLEESFKSQPHISE